MDRCWTQMKSRAEFAPEVTIGAPVRLPKFTTELLYSLECFSEPRVVRVSSSIQEGIISARLRLGDLLIRAKLVTEQDVARALERLTIHGGRLGDNLVALGAIQQETLDSFLHRTPAEPADIASTKLDEADLLGLMLKLIYTGRLQTVRQFGDAIKLPYHIVLELVRMAVDRSLLQNLGARSSDSLIDLAYTFTEEGRRYVHDALQRLHYTGPAPVTIEEFTDQVNLQKLTNELVTYEKIKAAIAGLQFDERIMEQCGPALNSGRAMLLYGPPGNGKTTVAQRFASVFSD